VPSLSDQPQTVEGLLELSDGGNGYLRNRSASYKARAGDPTVPAALVRAANLAQGLVLAGTASTVTQSGRERVELTHVTSINGIARSSLEHATPFPDLVSIDPYERLSFVRGPADISMRVLDLVAPVGKGQRGLIVAAPKAGKTTLIEQIAAGVSANHPDVELIVVLVDERPEEVTHLRRSIAGEVVAATSDESTEDQLRLGNLMLDRARRIVESGGDAVMLLDSLTRLGRASNRGQTGRGKTMSGGVDSRALEFPRKFFGAARKIEHGGSLTILATVIVGSGSQMDDVIFQEFKGTGNMELVLDRRLAEQRIFPAVDINASGTRKEEKLFEEWELPRVRALRRALATLKPAEAMTRLLKAVEETDSNRTLLERIPLES